MKKVGLFFGSFNPIHIGHLILGNYMADNSDLDEVWFVVSPHNPHKKKANLLDDHHRLSMVRIAVEDNNKLKASDVEFDLPKPSYTVFTLQKLKEDHPDKEFVLIMGEDNLRSFHKWKNHEYILKNHEIYVYPRVETIQEKQAETTSENELEKHDSIKVLKDVPMMKISSSYIRKAVKEGKDVKYLLSEAVFKYLDEMNYYK
ncbi:MAG: nicotinic acid mononucleotide adenylyltransferase [Crocinitomix sp. MedPE-SWsnd]|nr:MAG: nicotinic acid mononucleotide adenylyltransferase [Crocinitomix sp. MedPE-SWsnd]